MSHALRLLDGCELDLSFELVPAAPGPWVLVGGRATAECAGSALYQSGPYRLALERQTSAGATVIDFSLRRDDGAIFELLRYRVTSRVPCVDIITPAVRFTGYAHIKSHNPEELISTATTKEFPFALFGSRTGENRFSIGLQDLLTETRIFRGATRGRVYYDSVAACFERPINGVTLRTAEVRDALWVNRGRQSWYHTLCAYWDWIDRRRQYTPNPTPESAFGPIWCSWHYLTDIDEEKIWENAKAALALGIRVAVIDAGWYCPDVGVPFSDSPLTSNTFGFGRIEADKRKFPDMAGLVERIHRELGLFVWAWCTPRWTFRALESGPGAVDRRLLDLRVRTRQGEIAQFLCTRTPDAREHAARLTRNMLERYGFDGLKFDCWELDDAACVCTADHPHDTDTAGQGTLAWARTIRASMIAARPDAVVWFNNTSLKQFSSFSCSPNEVYCHPDENWRMSVLAKTYARGMASQLMEGSWHGEEEDKNVARQLAVFMMGHVPEVQVNLRELRESHKHLVKAWFGFYVQHRKDLLFGDYEPFGFEGMLGGPIATTPPNVRIDSGGKLFLLLGPVSCVSIAVRPETREIFVFNQRNGALQSLSFGGLSPGEWHLTVFDIFHEPVAQKTLEAKAGLVAVDLGISEGAFARLAFVGDA
jgi:hypothetical protein